MGLFAGRSEGWWMSRTLQPANHEGARVQRTEEEAGWGKNKKKRPGESGGPVANEQR